MKHFVRFLKLLFTKEYQENERLHLETTGVFLAIGILSLILILVEEGRRVLWFFAILVMIAIGLTCFSVVLSDFATIFKKFKAKKFQWEIAEEFSEEKVKKDAAILEEESVIVDVDVSAEGQIENEKSQAEIDRPYYFLDSSALEHYSGAFYISSLTQVFNPRCVTGEENVVLMTSKKVFDELKALEENPSNKEIYNGYTFLVGNNFKVVSLNQEEPLVDEIQKLQKEYTNLTFVTKDKTMAKALEGSAVKLQVLE